MKLIDKLPYFYTDCPVTNTIQDGLGSETDNLYIKVEDTKNQLYADSATWGIDLWEKFVGLKNNNFDLETRRKNVKAKLRGRGTTTIKVIENICEAYTNTNVDVEVFSNEFYFIIRFIANECSSEQIIEMDKAIEEIKPCHLGHMFEMIFRNFIGIKSKHISGNYVLPICNDLLVNYSYEFPVCGTYPHVIDRAYSNIQTVGLMAKARDFINEFRRCSNDESVGENLENIITSS